MKQIDLLEGRDMERDSKEFVWRKFSSAINVHDYVLSLGDTALEVFKDGYEKGSSIASEAIGMVMLGDINLSDLTKSLSYYDLVLLSMNYLNDIEDDVSGGKTIIKEMLAGKPGENEPDEDDMVEDIISGLFREGVYWGITDSLGRIGIIISAQKYNIASESAGNFDVSIRDAENLSITEIPYFVVVDGSISLNNKYRDTVAPQLSIKTPKTSNTTRKTKKDT